MKPRRSPRLAVLATLVTVAIVLAGVLGLPGTSPLRTAGGMVFGPIERALSPGTSDELSRVSAQRDRLAQELGQARAAEADHRAVADLLAAPSTREARVLPARVVGLGTSGPGGPERVTLDVGSRDGVVADRSVVSAGGLVGRVVSVAPWTCDIALLNAPEVTVGVRVGKAGILGSVRSAGGGLDGPRTAGQLSLELIGPGDIAPGDEVRTLGSVDGAPFVAGVRVGTVASVDPRRGRLATSAAVDPAVVATQVSIVGVLLSQPRETPRPIVTGAP